ncbi:hypothetical protein RFI_36409 [Reticulomyxa filosa]|uniref:Uncharacterized protein n=1 Tax=Reticulomyxa filosa TaxID=46433 RepID=X6LI44_RETFI|nr:hypothetical protein RFI_36409 [Reticulomyxa filosa]|eukprot:ETO01031.1 hypothetical protein RFI_36409 [Reticulomyxa filosa]
MIVNQAIEPQMKKRRRTCKNVGLNSTLQPFLMSKCQSNKPISYYINTLPLHEESSCTWSCVKIEWFEALYMMKHFLHLDYIKMDSASYVHSHMIAIVSCKKSNKKITFIDCEARRRIEEKQKQIVVLHTYATYTYKNFEMKATMTVKKDYRNMQQRDDK